MSFASICEAPVERMVSSTFCASTARSESVTGRPWHAFFTPSTTFSRLNGSMRSEEHTSELQSHRDLHSFPTRRSSDLLDLLREHGEVGIGDRSPLARLLHAEHDLLAAERLD